jgi:putative spermidine/putrescine transport system substrate-binding protein
MNKFYMIIILLLLASCAKQVGSSDPLSMTFDEINKKAEGSEVSMYMWGGSTAINDFMDNIIGSKLSEKHGVTLKRVPIQDIKDIVNKLIVEKEAEKNNGTVDILWINGENFRLAKESGVLFGPFTEKLPSYKAYIDTNAADLLNDFGTPTDGYEAPWGKAQFVMVYNSEKIETPPTTPELLKEFVQNNPGRFTYPAPPDFTGSAFVRNIMYLTAGGHEKFLSADSSSLQTLTQPTWDYLNEIEGSLWRSGETYPENLAKLDQLYANGEVWITMDYNPVKAANMVKSGQFPESTRTFVFDKGTISNTHYLAIPFNSSNKEGAMIVINFLLSPEGQFLKFQPENWGDETVLDFSKVEEDYKNKFKSIDRGEATLPADVLASHRLPEIPATSVDIIEKLWFENTAK